jgi:hypothetical protein
MKNNLKEDSEENLLSESSDEEKKSFKNEF